MHCTWLAIRSTKVLSSKVSDGEILRGELLGIVFDYIYAVIPEVCYNNTRTVLVRNT